MSGDVEVGQWRGRKEEWDSFNETCLSVDTDTSYEEDVEGKKVTWNERFTVIGEKSFTLQPKETLNNSTFNLSHGKRPVSRANR